LIKPQGGVALFSESYPEVPENRWHEEFKSLVDKYAVVDPARPLIKAAPRHEAVLLRSAFSHLERISVFERRRTQLERFADRALSFATTWHGQMGGRGKDLAGEATEALKKYAVEGFVEEVIEGEALIARRPAEI
jgi:hypothetical protein